MVASVRPANKTLSFIHSHSPPAHARVGGLFRNTALIWLAMNTANKEA